MNPEPEESNTEHIANANFDLATGRYRMDDDEIVPCAMLDGSIVFTVGEEDNGI